MKPKPKQKSERDVQFAKGGNTPMHSKQAAGAAKGGHSGKVQSPAPGAKAASGGPRTSGLSLSTPAKAGHTSQIRKGR